MKRGCFFGLLTWGACAYGYWYLFHPRLVGNIRWVLPLAGGLVMALVVGGLTNAVRSARDAMRFSGTSEPGTFGERPQDGAIVTVSGHIRAAGQALHAPLSGRPAVLYTYDISHTVTSKDEVREATDFAGFGLAPAVIDSPHGPMRILGFPNLEAFDKGRLESVDQPAVEKYLVDTEFTDMAGFHPGKVYQETKELLTGDEGHLRKDWREYSPAKPEAGTAKQEAPQEGDAEDREDPQKEWARQALEDRNFFEQIVAPGEQVSAIGRYSQQKGGLVPDMSHPLQLLRGDARAAAGTLWSKMAVQIAGALFFAALVNGLAFGVFKLHKPGNPIAFSADTIEHKTEAMFEAARKGDVAAIEQIVSGGMPVDARRGTERQTPLMVAADANTTRWLIAHGADVNAATSKGETPLMFHAQYGSADSVKLLLKSGANVNAKENEYKMSALQYALLYEKQDIAQVLRDAGAKDDTINDKNGHAVGETSDEVRAVLEYIDAIQREDRKALSALSTLGSFDGVDFKVWKNSRFAKGRLVSGFANDNAATIVMRGATPGGVYVTWTYQLARTAGGWKVSGERWETKLSGSEP